MRRLIILCLMLIVMGCSKQPARFVMGDVVCVSGLESKGIVKWVDHSIGLGYKYKIVFEGGNEVWFGFKQEHLVIKCKEG